MVIQCLRDVASPISDAVIEFQLDGVPSATPPDVIERLLGVIDAGDDVLAELQPVVEFGPVLSVTRLAGGGEVMSITDLDTIEISSDGDPTDPAFAFARRVRRRIWSNRDRLDLDDRWHRHGRRDLPVIPIAAKRPSATCIRPKTPRDDAKMDVARVTWTERRSAGISRRPDAPPPMDATMLG